MVYKVLSIDNEFAARDAENSDAEAEEEEDEPVSINILKTKKGAGAAWSLPHTTTVDDLPAFYKKTYMGVEFARELTAVVYRTRRFVLRHQAELEDFLVRDIFETNCTPADHVTSLVIYVSLNRWDKKAEKEIPWRSTRYDAPYKEHFEKAVKPLHALLALVPKQNARLHIIFPKIRHWESNANAIKLAATLVPFAYDMKDKGWHVEFDSIGRSLHGSHHAEKADFDFTLSRQEWEEQIRTNSKFVSSCSMCAFVRILTRSSRLPTSRRLRRRPRTKRAAHQPPVKFQTGPSSSSNFLTTMISGPESSDASTTDHNWLILAMNIWD
jgi:hypothetical protein